MHKRAFLLMLLGFIGLLFITTFSVFNLIKHNSSFSLIKHNLSFSYSNVDKTQIEQAGLWNNKSKASEVTLIAAQMIITCLIRLIFVIQTTLSMEP